MDERENSGGMADSTKEFQKYATEEVLVWFKKLRVVNRAHWETAELFKRYGFALGVVSVSVTAVAGTSVFANLTTSPIYWLQVLAGFLTFVAVVSAALQNYLDYPRRAERHRQMGILFGGVKRLAEIKLANPPSSRTELETSLREIGTKWNEVATNQPSIPQWLLEKVEKDVESKPERRRLLDRRGE